MALTTTSSSNDIYALVFSAKLKLMRAASEKTNLRVLVCQANFFDSLVNGIRQRRKELLSQQPRVVQQHTADLFENSYTLSPKKPAKKNMKVIKPTERFTINDNKMAKTTNSASDELNPLNFRPQFKEKQKLSIFAVEILPDKNPIKSKTIASVF